MERPNIEIDKLIGYHTLSDADRETLYAYIQFLESNQVTSSTSA